LYEDISWLDNEVAFGEYSDVYVEGARVEDYTRSWRDIGAPHRPKVLLLRKTSTTAASVTAKASIDTTLQVHDDKEGANEHTHASGAMSAPPQSDVANVNKGPVPHENSSGRSSQPDAAKFKVNFTAATAASTASVNSNGGDQLVPKGLPIVEVQTTACKSHCDVVASPVLQKVLLDSKGGAPLPHNLPPQKPSVRISSDSDIMQKVLNFTHQNAVQYMTFTSSSIERVEHVAMLARTSHLEVKVKVEHNLSPQKPSVCTSSDSDIRQQNLNFTHQSAVHYMTFTSSSIERVEHVAMFARASHLVLKVKVEAMTKKVSPVLTNPSGDPQARNIPTRRFSCRIMKPTHQVRENPHSFFDMKPTTMVRKKKPFRAHI